MKQRLKTFLSLLILVLISIGAFAQEQGRRQPRFPRWISEKGYWVVETNRHSPRHHLIRFYNNDHILLYSKSLAGVKLNPDKRRVKMKLKRELETAIVAWEKKINNPSPANPASFAGASQPL
jgi:hypothetical protein